eukprot:SAG31_NODE_218_length_19934_cov_81.634837_3_plen_411_part_00
MAGRGAARSAAVIYEAKKACTTDYLEPACGEVWSRVPGRRQSPHSLCSDRSSTLSSSSSSSMAPAPSWRAGAAMFGLGLAVQLARPRGVHCQDPCEPSPCGTNGDCVVENPPSFHLNGLEPGPLREQLASFDVDADNELHATVESSELRAACDFFEAEREEHGSLISNLASACDLLGDHVVPTAGPCHFQALCEMDDTFRCDCAPGFTGSNCDLRGATVHFGEEVQCEFEWFAIQVTPPSAYIEYSRLQVHSTLNGSAAIIYAQPSTVPILVCGAQMGGYSVGIVADGPCPADYDISMGSYVVTTYDGHVITGEGACDNPTEFELCLLDGFAAFCPDSTECNNGGTCTVACNERVCACAAGYEGSNCELFAADDCLSEPCMNDASASAWRTQCSCGHAKSATVSCFQTSI